MFLRAVGFSGLAFVVAVSSLLSAVIVRGPQTHDHIAASLRDSYDRTPLDPMNGSDLASILADLPDFSFPAQPVLVAVPGVLPVDEAAHTIGDEHDEADNEAAAQQPPTQKLTLTTSEFGFDPSRVELQVGVPVELTVLNDGDQVHGIWIPDYAISADIRSGKSKTFTFTPEQSGRIRFTCNYNLCGTEEEHAQMTGFITVK